MQIYDFLCCQKILQILDPLGVTEPMVKEGNNIFPFWILWWSQNSWLHKQNCTLMDQRRERVKTILSCSYCDVTWRMSFHQSYFTSWCLNIFNQSSPSISFLSSPYCTTSSSLPHHLRLVPLPLLFYFSSRSHFLKYIHTDIPSIKSNVIFCIFQVLYYKVYSSFLSSS